MFQVQAWGRSGFSIPIPSSSSPPDQHAARAAACTMCPPTAGIFLCADPPWRVGSQGARGGGRQDGCTRCREGLRFACRRKGHGEMEKKIDSQRDSACQRSRAGAGGWCIPHCQEHSPRPRWVKLGKWGDFTWDKTPAGMGSEPSQVCRGKQAWREWREKGPGSIAGGQALSQYF